MARITIMIDDATLATLDRVASELSSNRSQAIRYIVKMYQEETKMPETINVEFNPKDLPRWAQNDPNVVYGCEASLAFRVNVFDAKTPEMRRYLKRLYREECGEGEGSMRIKFKNPAIQDRNRPGSCIECQKPDFPGVNQAARIVSHERTGSSTWVEVEISAQAYEALGAWLDGQA